MRTLNRKPRLLWFGPYKSIGGITVITKRFLGDPEVHRCYDVKIQDQGFLGKWNEVYLLRFLKIPVSLVWLVWNMLIFRPDIVHVHTAYREGFLRDGLICLIAKLFGSKVVLTFHPGWGESLQKNYYNGSSWLKKLTCWVVPKVDALVANGPSYKEFLQKEFNHKNIHILQNPIPDDEIPPESCDYSKREKIVFFAGFLDQRKGVFELMQAAERLPDAKFIIYGTVPGPENMARFMDAFNSSPARSRIHLDLGWGTEKVFFYMQQARVLALPSWGESLPQILEEAIICGIPVVTTPVGVIADYVQDGVHGHLVKPGDVEALVKSIRHILEDEEWALQVQQVNRIAGKQFLRSQVHPRWLKMYDDLLGS